MNPNGLVPVLRDGELVMWESCAILRYLGARYGRVPFWPADPVARAPVDMWAEWGKTTLARDFTGPIFWARGLHAGGPARPRGARGGARRLRARTSTILEAQLGDGP